MKALRIGIDVREWRSGTSTGIGRFLEGFIGWGVDSSEHRFLLVGDQDTEQRHDDHAGKDLRDQVELWRIPQGVRVYWDQVLLPRWLRSHGVDVFLSPYYKVPLRAPCPVVATVHDLIPLHFPGSRSRVLPRSLLRGWMRLMLGAANRVVTDSEFSRRDLVATLKLDTGDIDVVPLWVDAAFQAPPDAQLVATVLRGHGLQPGYVLYVGRHAPHKNVGLLVDAWTALDHDTRSAHPLVLAGSGGDAFADRAPGARALGLVPDVDLPALYAGADLFVFPSLYEGFGLPPLEAMACGTPVVCSDAGSLPEVVGEAALLCSPHEPDSWAPAMQQALDDEALRARLIAAGSERVRAYSPHRTVPRLMAVLEKTGATGVDASAADASGADPPGTAASPS